MLRVKCDTCGTVRDSRQRDWIVGYDLRLDSPKTGSRSISFFDHWDDLRILERGAIHFCSEKCKQAYIAANTPERKAGAKNASPRKVPAKWREHRRTVGRTGEFHSWNVESQTAIYR